MVIVEHNVSVRLAKSHRESSSNTMFLGSSKPEYDTRPFRRSFSLLGVALSVLSDLCSISLESEKIQLLKFHRKSIAICYFMAICFKETIKSSEDVVTFGIPANEYADVQEGMGVKEDTEEEASSNDDEESKCKYIFDSKSASVIRDMMAIGESESRRMLERHVGNVTEKYWKDHHVQDEEEGVKPDGSDGTPEDDDIDLGVIELDM